MTRAGAHRRVATRLLLATCATVVTLAAAELALRVLGLPAQIESFRFLGAELGSDEFIADDELFWRLAPGVNYEVNALGLRGWLPRGAKGAHDLRIACVGDSCTFGVAVRYEETWGVLLERALRAVNPGRRVESILAANPGYSTHQNRLLYERHVLPLAPDVTVLYVGGWNDYVAAVGPNDRERTARRESRWHASRIVQLLSRSDAGDRDEVMAAFNRDEAPFGRRVPLADYETNVRAMIAAARDIGSVVLMVLPPLTQASLQRHPSALDYRAATTAIARATNVPIFDAPARFQEAHAAAPPDWRARPQGEWPCLGDWVHPTVMGHRVIAEGLVELLREHWPALFDGGSGAPAPIIDTVTPGELTWFAAPSLRIRGRGLASGGIDRVWLGDAWLREFDVLDDTTIDVPLTRALRAGDHVLELLTPAGTVRAPTPVRVIAPELRATIARTGDRIAIEVTCAGRPDWPGTLWLSPALRPEPADTRYGPFALVAEPDGRPPGFPLTPFYFDRPHLISRQGRCGADGIWRERIEHDTGANLEAVCLQAMLVNPAVHGDAVLTQAVRLVIPPR